MLDHPRPSPDTPRVDLERVGVLAGELMFAELAIQMFERERQWNREFLARFEDRRP